MNQPVIYRYWRGEFLAILPGLPVNFGNVAYYAHEGQHGEADSSMTRAGRLATPAEYESLHKELIRVGYNDLVIRKRSQIKKGWQS